MSNPTFQPVTAASPVSVSVSEATTKTSNYGDGYVVHLKTDGPLTYIAAAVENSLMPKFISALDGTREKMLVDAVNNRTRERNYYQLYSRLLENEITDEEFDREIDEHPDEYIISADNIPSELEFHESIALSDHIKGIETTGDIETLFSFRGEEFNNYCKRLLNGTL